MPVISVENLRKVYRVPVKEEGGLSSLRHFFRRRYREIEAVRGITFRVERGEVVGFLGPNGAGKTTTLKMLVGLIKPTSGKVRVLGYDPFERRKDFLKRITLVMGQKQQLIWDLPPMDSLRINAAVYEIDDETFKRRVALLAEMLGIEHRLHQPVRKLSLGERMKAELLAALIHDPEVLFLDEPTLGLDVSAQISIRRFLRNYNEEFNATIILTSHYMADIEALCDRAMVIHRGRLIFDGDLYELAERVMPFKEIYVEFKGEIPVEELQRIGEIREIEGQEVKLLVRRDEVFDKVRLIMERWNIDDLSVTDPPLDEVLAKVFEG
ncbi:MAG: ATP-binding cassette domain-containing protein [Thermotogae bacterium]|nr:ATP-binding cassette domain-containing protein [Thermotogota bacterium]